MLLIAESGATKTEWRLLDNDHVPLAFRTAGFNPNVMNPDQIRQELEDIYAKHLKKVVVHELYFYGAGLREESTRLQLQQILQSQFRETRVFVFHDLIAAVHSSGQKEGIVGILGTGSNSCYYKDGKILRQLGGHGYLLGDEGSGADLGRTIIKRMLDETLPEHIRTFFELQEGVRSDQIRLAIYRDSKPNVRMSRFAKYLDEVLHEPVIQDLVRERFLIFLDRTVCRYHDFGKLPINFFGSVAHFFKAQLQEACELRGITGMKIEHDPIDDLVAYHMRNLA